MKALTVGQAAARTGWSARMLRYLETVGLVVPGRTPSGYRLYGDAELLQLQQLRQLRERFGIELDEVAFAARLRRDPEPARRSTPGCTRPARAPTGSSGNSESNERLISAA